MGKDVLEDAVGRIHREKAVVNATPFRAAWENSRASIGRTRTMPWVSTKATRMTSSFSSSIFARIAATISWRSGESSPIRASKLGRPSEFSAAPCRLVLMLSNVICDRPQ